jgi:hypothetical protein
MFSQFGQAGGIGVAEVIRAELVHGAMGQAAPRLGGARIDQRAASVVGRACRRGNAVTANHAARDSPERHGKPHRPPPPPQPTGTGAATDRPANDRCVDVTVGGERSFGCINQLLKEKVVQTNPTMNTPPIDARSPDLKPAL